MEPMNHQLRVNVDASCARNSHGKFLINASLLSCGSSRNCFAYSPCETRASIPLDAIRRPRDTPIWKLEAALKHRSCKKGRYASPVHMIKLTQEREITPYVWVHPVNPPVTPAGFSSGT
jgi:hypothetical protein